VAVACPAAAGAGRVSGPGAGSGVPDPGGPEPGHTDSADAGGGCRTTGAGWRSPRPSAAVAGGAGTPGPVRAPAGCRGGAGPGRIPGRAATPRTGTAATGRAATRIARGAGTAGTTGPAGTTGTAGTAEPAGTTGTAGRRYRPQRRSRRRRERHHPRAAGGNPSLRGPVQRDPGRLCRSGRGPQADGFGDPRPAARP